jgi:hypothetical protein
MQVLGGEVRLGHYRVLLRRVSPVVAQAVWKVVGMSCPLLVRRQFSD